MSTKVDQIRLHGDTFKSRYAILLIVLAGTFMSVLDSNVVSTALPTITRFFGTGLGTSQWAITAYLITATALLLVFGRLAGYVGNEKLFTAGLAIFMIGSLACGLSSSMEMLIASRVAQAIGAAMVFSISFAILMQAFPRSEWGRTMGLNAATVAIAMLAGPVIGGLVVDWLGWPYIFFINLPIGAVLLAACPKYLRPAGAGERAMPMDWIGSSLLVVLMVSLTLLLQALCEGISVTAQMAAYAGIFLFSLAAFILRESRCNDPLLDLSAFRVKGFTLPLAAMILYFSATIILSVIGPFYYQIVLGYSATQSGTISLVPTLVMAIGSPVGGMMYDRYKQRNFAAPGILVLGLALAACGYLYNGMDIVPVIGSIVVAGAGAALFQSANNADVMGALPEARTNEVSSILATSRNLGMALGTALASILVSYQLEISGHGGDMIHAGGPLLAGILGNVMYVAGLMCALGAVLSLRLWSRPPKNINRPVKTIQEIHEK